MLRESLVARVRAPLQHALHLRVRSFLLQQSTSPSPCIFMQKEEASSAVFVQPKRTARKGAKANDRSRTLKAPRIVKENDATGEDGNEDAAMREVWRLFCKSEIPTLVLGQMRTIKELEMELGEDLIFGGPRGSLKGRPGAVEDHRHRAFYGTLSDSEEKLQNFAARQVSCRVLGSKGYACENCWLPLQDCMCKELKRGILWEGVSLWLYTHPKDFLRKNNTGKLLWQVFGDQEARLVVCGIREQEEVMWDHFKQAGRDQVWCVYPEKGSPEYRVADIPIPEGIVSGERSKAGSNTIHLILIDGTWSNSKSMVSRLKERAVALWGESGMHCVALSPSSVSVMHDLRPQPSMERTCTAAAAAQLLQELSIRSELASKGLGQAAELVEGALSCLQNALVTRRSRVGRSTSRAQSAYSRSGRSPL